MRSLFTTSLALLLTLAVLSTASAQVAHVLSPGYAPGTQKVNLPSPAFTTGAAAGLAHLPEFWASSHPTPVFGGGLAIDQIERRMYASDGFKIWQESMTQFPPLAAPAPITAAPALLGGPFSPLSGMSMDPTGQRLFICDTVSFGVFSPAAPYAAISAPVYLPTPHSPFTGMAYDPSDDTLWFCDIQGGVYHTDVNGTPIAGEYPISFVSAALTGICVDRSAGPGAFPTIMPPTVAGGPAGTRPRVWVTSGLNVIEAIGSSVAIPLPAGGGHPYGMAFSADGQFSYGGSGGSTQPRIRQDRPSANGFGLGTRIMMDTVPPVAGQNQVVILLYGWYPIAGGGLFGGTRRLSPAVAPIVFPVTNTGHEEVALPDLMEGISLSFQFGTINYGGGLPFALAISDCLTYMSARP